MQSQFEMADLVREMRDLVARHRSGVFGVGAVIIGVYTPLDLAMGQMAGLPELVVGLVLQYAFLARVLDAPAGRWRLGSLMGSEFLAGLGTLLGLLLLVVPGLLIALRWSLSAAFVVKDEQRAYEALSSSRVATAACWRPLLTVFAIIFAIFGGGLVGTFAANDVYNAVLPQWAWALAQNVWQALFSLASWLTIAGAYRLISGRADELTEVFI
ncbi:hypothetical protein [Novosphingobium sp. Leaf2]|uniref:hypothetical protein n=1 Tax=Novosphingobium sp. Leaf2 TaxID=1735670 RepID=UPI0006F6E615|nr:hypothetical protein [Novosphingobium sp. Leaf2]KQM19299.1 hypothetical protein ASE49_03365 [Novosphingobium sp. Leaf2]